MKDDKLSFNAWEFESETFIPNDKTEEVTEFFKELVPDKVVSDADKVNRKHASSLRLLLDRFTKTQAQKPEGTSYLSPIGMILMGHNVGDRNRMRREHPEEILLRSEKMKAFALAQDYGLQETLKKSGFIKNKDNDYDDLKQAYMAIELESIGKKGPFDGDDDDIALKVADSLLGAAASPKEMSDSTRNYYLEEALKRRSELEEHVDRKFSVKAEHYLEMLAHKGLLGTHRGSPSHSAGDNAVNYNTIMKWKQDLESVSAAFAPFFNGLNYDDEDSYKKWKEEHLANIIKLFDETDEVEEIKTPILVKFKYDKIAKMRVPSNLPHNTTMYRKGNDYYYDQITSNKHKVYTKWGVTWSPNVYSHNYLLYELLKFMEVNNILLGDIINIKMCQEVPISRDQGAPYDRDKHDEEGVVIIILKDRKGRKYRIVIPAPALAQAYIQLYTTNLIDNIKNVRGRIGISEPDVNIDRMNELIHNNAILQGYGEPIDFDTYDYRVTSQELSINCHNFAELYDDPRVKDAFKVASFVMSHKIVLLPQYIDEGGHNYENFLHVDAKNIKGDPRYLRQRALKGVDKKKVREFLDEAKDSFQYKGGWFYIYLNWLISGIILTNTVGSENTILMGRVLIREMETNPIFDKWLTDQDRIRIREWRLHYTNETSEVVGNGDDCLLTLPLFLIVEKGRKAVLEMIEFGMKELFGAIVKEAKQMKITYKGLPLVEMLQHIYPQGDHPELQGRLVPYLKFMRQSDGLPYTERHTNRPFLQRYDSVEGRFDSCLCKMNVDFAASCIYYSGVKLNQIYRKRGWYAERMNPDTIDGFGYDYDSHPRVSMLGGFQQYLGFKKTYGNDFIPQLTKLSVEVIMNGPGEYDDKLQRVKDMVNDFRDELETRAPHRGYLERIEFANVESNLKEKLGLSDTKDDGTSFSSLTVDLVESLERQFGIVIKPYTLPVSTTNKVEGLDIDEGPSAEGLE